MSDDASDAALMEALQATPDEKSLLASVSNPFLCDKLLLGVLRAPVEEPLHVLVCPDMHKSDQFNNFIIDEAVKMPYVAAHLERKRIAPPLFTLSCPSIPANNMQYDGRDAVQDKLIEYFCKDLIRFASEERARFQLALPLCVCVVF